MNAFVVGRMERRDERCGEEDGEDGEDGVQRR